MSAKHTQGPYHVEPFIYEGHQSSVSVHAAATDAHPGGIIIANLSHASNEHQRFCFVDTPEEAMANARLLAAAPDLLAACKRLLVNVHWESMRADIVTDEAKADMALARAAIAKATGESA